MRNTNCHLCEKTLTTEDDPHSCICNECMEIELVDELPDSDGIVEDEKYMTD